LPQSRRSRVGSRLCPGA